MGQVHGFGPTQVLGVFTSALLDPNRRIVVFLQYFTSQCPKGIPRAPAIG